MTARPFRGSPVNLTFQLAQVELYVAQRHISGPIYTYDTCEGSFKGLNTSNTREM